MARPAHTDQPFGCSPSAQEGEGNDICSILQGEQITSDVLRRLCKLLASPAVALQHVTHSRGKEGSSTSCTLVQSDGIHASSEDNQQAKSNGSRQLSTLVGKIWPQDIRSCKTAGRRKTEVS